MFRNTPVFAFLLASHVSAATFTVTNTNDSGAGSLRKAIEDANANPGFDTIAFDIPGAGVHTITPATPLPQISEDVVIDGYTQPGSSENTDPVATNAVLLIELDGSVAGGTGLHFTFASSPSTIQGLVVNHWDLAIMIQGAATIRGNFIGTDPTGSSARANERGIDMGPSNAVVVGGTTWQTATSFRETRAASRTQESARKGPEPWSRAISSGPMRPERSPSPIASASWTESAA